MNRPAPGRSLVVAIAVALGGFASDVRSVVLDARGMGQVLIYPYYTVNHQQTLVSVVNTQEFQAALKVRFREGYDGREVASFNLYLGGYDTWVGAVFDTSSDGSGGAAIATNDSSCTVPQFDATFFPRGAKVLAFSNKNYSQGGYGMPTGTDSGPTGLDRTREGFIEVVEMGVIFGGSTDTQNCAQLVDAWTPGGYWTANPKVNLQHPIGGLYGAAGIVDVAEGTLYAYDATAIDGFSELIQHTAPGDAKPNLGTAVTDSAADIATAYVPIGNAMIKADYPASTRAVDAVSAVLMADKLFNEYLTDASVGASSEWVVTFPTKQFYVDPAIVGASSSGLPPFEATFGGGVSCATKGVRYFDRDGANPLEYGCGFPECPLSNSQYLCYETELITFNQNGVEPGIETSIFGSLLAINVPAYLSGWFELSLSNNAQQALRASIEGNAFSGLPVAGFLGVNYINANVTPGVLSNYSGTYPHRSTVSCTNSTNLQSACK